MRGPDLDVSILNRRGAIKVRLFVLNCFWKRKTTHALQTSLLQALLTPPPVGEVDIALLITSTQLCWAYTFNTGSELRFDQLLNQLKRGRLTYYRRPRSSAKILQYINTFERGHFLKTEPERLMIGSLNSEDRPLQCGEPVSLLLTLKISSHTPQSSLANLQVWWEEAGASASWLVPLRSLIQ